MDIARQEIHAVPVITPGTDRLDAAVAPAFKSRLVDEITSGTTRLVVDLTPVDFMDSSGLAALMSSLKTLGGRGELVLCGLGEKVAKLFAITKLDRGAFRIFATAEEAAAALAHKD